MRKLVYYVACTVDRFIAREDGSFDCFPFEGEHFSDLIRNFPDTIPGHAREAMGVRETRNILFDTVLMGRKTYEVGLREGITSPYPHLRQYLFSKSMSASPHDNVTLVSDDPLSVVKGLKEEDGLDIWLCGGAELAGALLPEIDKLILKVNPVLIGSGIPLWSKPVTTRCLALTEMKSYNNGFVIMHYDVLRLGLPESV